MKKLLMKYRRILFTIIGILPLLASLWGSSTALAATARADISVTLFANRSKVKPGQTVTYTAIMTNHGPDDAAFVDLYFNWPEQLTLVDMTCDFGISPDTPACEYSTLAAGETVVSTFVATPNPGVHGRDREIRVSANVVFEVDCSFDPNCTFDPHTRNNSARVFTKLTDWSDHR